MAKSRHLTVNKQTMKLSQLINSQEGLKKLMETKLPVKVAYKVSKIISKCQPDLKIYEEQRINLVKELGEESDTDKDNWTVKPENLTKFTEEMNKLLDVEVDLGFGLGKDLDKIKVEEFGDVAVEPQLLLHLDWLIE